MADQSNIQSAASKSIRPFKSSEEYLYAMKEDLAEWLNTLYDLDILADTFMEGLETGCALCQHANNVNRAALDFQLEYPEVAKSMRMPSKDVVFQSRNVVPGSFLARDNVSNFIGWCRQELCIKDVLMFETNDLVQKRNEKNFVLCLLEVARRGAKFGMLAPMLIQLEEEIEEEIRDQENLGEASPPSIGFSRMESARDPTPGLYPNWQQKRVLCDMRNLDELVREILGGCSCPSQFPMTKVSEGKYKVGDSSALIFIRVLRTHVMVRVGGGWDTLEHYLDKHDPCRCTAFAHRYQQSKSGGQGPHSKSSSTHSSRSTSPGPHWRNEAVGPFKTPDKRSLEPLAASSRPGRGHRPSLPVELDANTAGTATLIPRPPRDHSEPRPLHPLRSKDTALPATRKLSGDSDSSTASSKGGAVRVSGGGTRRLGEEVVLLVNRKEGKHVIERARREGRIPSLQPPQARARSHSRERPMAAALKPSPPQGPPDGSWSIRSERGRSLGPEGPRRLQAPRSHSQGKMPSRSRVGEASPGPRPHIRDPQPPHSDRREDRRTKQAPQASPKLSGGGFPRRQMASSNSPGKGGLHSPSKKAVATPRPPAPRSPSMGGRRLLPPVSQPGRQSPLSSPHSSPRSPRATRASRSTGLGRLGRGSFECQEPEEEGRSFPAHLLPSLDPQKEHELYRSFEAEFLANARLAGVGSSREAKGKDPGGLHLPPTQQQEQGFRGLLPTAPGEGNTTDSAYSSSSSSSSSINVGVKVGVLPELHESRRVSPRCCPIEDSSLESQTSAVPHNDSHAMSGHWGCHGAPYRKLPALSNSSQDRELLASLRDPNLLTSKGHIFTKPGLSSMDINDGPGAASLQQQSFVQATEVLMDGRQARLEWTRGEEVQAQQDHHLSFPYDVSDELDTDHPDGTLHPADPCPSPLPLPPSEDCSFKDSSSESSSMCISLSETHSEGGSPPPPSANGDLGVVLRPKKGLKKPDRVPSIYKLKLRPKIRPRTENRPENSPSRIPTPVSYREQQKSASHTPPHSPQTNGLLRSRKERFLNPRAPSPGTGQRDCSSSVESGSLDDEAWM